MSGIELFATAEEVYDKLNRDCQEPEELLCVIGAIIDRYASEHKVSCMKLHNMLHETASQVFAEFGEYGDHPRTWKNVELTKSEALPFRIFLTGKKYKFETCSAGSLVHFEVFVNDIELNECDEFLELMSNAP